jgi:hypothetical protein
VGNTIPVLFRSVIGHWPASIPHKRISARGSQEFFAITLPDAIYPERNCLAQFIQSERVSHRDRYDARSMHKTRRRKMTVDVDEGRKAEEQSSFLAQLQAIGRLARE